MASVSTGTLRKMEICIEKFIGGERISNTICLTQKIAKILEKKYPEITLSKRESVNKELGLYNYLIRNSDL